jgi:aminocarboxymuconate-semialdehyde decarboxylase
MIIDIHGHITSPALFKRFPMPPSLADIDGMIERKAQLGIDLTIIGSPVGEGTMMKVPGLNNYDQTPEQLRSFHDFLAETVAKHPQRLRAYAYTNPFGGEKLLTQTADMVKKAEFVGLIINTSVQGEYLDSEAADPFFAMAAELDVPIFLHPPAEPVGSGSFRDFRLVEQVGRFCDMTASLASLIFSGRLEKYPNLKFVGATGGGAISLLPSRLDLAYQPRHWQSGEGQAPAASAGPARPPGGAMIQSFENKISKKPSTYLKSVYVDTACQSFPLLSANLEMVGADHILFGTDSPPLVTPLGECIDLINRLPIPDGDKQKIFSGNAKRLFRLGGDPGTMPN